VRSSKTTALTQVPLSGDKLVDWVFKQFVFFLRRETLRIKRKRRLRSPDDPSRELLRGMLWFESETSSAFDIGLNSAKCQHSNRDEELETLVHELCHLVFWKIQHRFIWQLERIVFNRLTQEQKNYLKSFIPRHEVKSV
jgi:hypothetical protein